MSVLVLVEHDGRTVKDATLATKSPADLGVDVARRLETLKVVEPAKRQAGIKVGSVDELVERLKGMGIAK